MDIIRDKSKVQEGTAVALGNFDGIHLGHIELIKQCRAKAKSEKLKLAILTFDQKLTELKIGRKNSSLTSEFQKQRLFKDLSVDVLYILNFEDDVREMSPDEFIEKVLIDKLNSKQVFVGFNFKFGKDAYGNSALLEAAGKRLGFKTTVIDPVKVKGEIASSSAVRRYLKDGEIESANKILGRPYEIRGMVIRGKGRGKVMGFATANLKPEIDYVAPKNGVYKTVTVYNGKEYDSLTNVGENPTFGDVSFSIETHILGFNQDIYDEIIEVKFVRFIREEVRFHSVDNLIDQVKSDIAEIIKKY